jgi:hypothetical protein
MQVRLSAFANLANEIGHMTRSFGGILVQATTTRERTLGYSEDHF